jgi:hypothetical protein
VSAYLGEPRPKFELVSTQFQIQLLFLSAAWHPLLQQALATTDEFIKTLEGVGFPREQAEAQVQLIIDSFQENVATKADLAELKADVRSEMSELKSQMAEMKTDLVFRLGSLIVVCTGLLGVLIKF